LILEVIYLLLFYLIDLLGLISSLGVLSFCIRCIRV